MNTALSVVAGLVWGGIFAVINAFITKKMVSGGDRQISSMSLIRTLIDAFALAVVYFTRNLLPLRFEVTLISAAAAMSIVGIVVAFRTAASMKQ